MRIVKCTMKENGLVEEEDMDFAADKTSMSVIAYSYYEYTYSTGEKIQFQYVMVNQGNAFNQYNATLTVPFTGNYTFNTYAYLSSSSRYCRSGSSDCFVQIQNLASPDLTHKITTSIRGMWKSYATWKNLKKGEQYQIVASTRLELEGSSSRPIIFSISGRP